MEQSLQPIAPVLLPPKQAAGGEELTGQSLDAALEGTLGWCGSGLYSALEAGRIFKHTLQLVRMGIVVSHRYHPQRGYALSPS
jgi:hypothetical protein